MTTSRLEVLVGRATVWLGPDERCQEGPGGHAMWGSGFFVAPGWVLTCAHVLRPAGESGPRSRLGEDAARPFLVHGEHGRVRARAGYWLMDGEGAPEQDLVLVRLLEETAHSCVWLTDRCDRPFRVTAHG
ncbi:trypsin-like peptidase domain-containing protein [Streptomyces iconiensis]|uniref:Trypsin-like peptidase domain-containing protein n=1 Tax=Streptomyces iconiensis TaxID=1384038 RepID=A0ABT7A1S4_9ACTN|nr:trypsin-like peptidase domain-containing protein [Streptomyces iconiensis]MDJ1135270.1 trypsin-like peptidase domain-containing protein [Streptomyces iconiensis]